MNERRWARWDCLGLRVWLHSGKCRRRCSSRRCLTAIDCTAIQEPACRTHATAASNMRARLARLASNSVLSLLACGPRPVRLSVTMQPWDDLPTNETGPPFARAILPISNATCPCDPNLASPCCWLAAPGSWGWRPRGLRLPPSSRGCGRSDGTTAAAQHSDKAGGASLPLRCFVEGAVPEECPR